MQNTRKQNVGRLYLIAALVLSSINLVAVVQHAQANSTHQEWMASWDIFEEPLNYTTSKVIWTHPRGTSRLLITYVLRSARPNWQYQVGVHIFDRCPTTFGQFPSLGPCESVTRQDVMRVVAGIELGVVTTDINGNGLFTVLVNGIQVGTYEIEFNVRLGVGCNLEGGGLCDVVFQSPGPFGIGITTITFP